MNITNSPNLLNRIARRTRKEYFKFLTRGQDTIARVRERHADFAHLREAICAGGTDKLDVFKNGYTREGGLYLQQNPDEFASLCFYLQENKPFKNYLEIGSASGGACLFLYEKVGFENVWSLDDGQHPRAVEQRRHFDQINNFQQFLGDSHSKAAKQYLNEHVSGKLDVAFIDGDHSYEGAWQDVELVLPHCRSGASIIFHDTVACYAVRQVWMKCIFDKLLDAKAEYVGEDLPLGIAIGTVR